jgi:hypothetical protein
MASLLMTDKSNRALTLVSELRRDFRILLNTVLGDHSGSESHVGCELLAILPCKEPSCLLHGSLLGESSGTLYLILLARYKSSVFYLRKESAWCIFPASQLCLWSWSVLLLDGWCVCLLIRMKRTVLKLSSGSTSRLTISLFCDRHTVSSNGWKSSNSYKIKAASTLKPISCPQTRTKQGRSVLCKFHNTGSCLPWAKVPFNLAFPQLHFCKCAAPRGWIWGMTYDLKDCTTLRPKSCPHS